MQNRLTTAAERRRADDENSVLPLRRVGARPPRWDIASLDVLYIYIYIACLPILLMLEDILCSGPLAIYILVVKYAAGLTAGALRRPTRRQYVSPTRTSFGPTLLLP